MASVSSVRSDSSVLAPDKFAETRYATFHSLEPPNEPGFVGVLKASRSCNSRREQNILCRELLMLYVICGAMQPEGQYSDCRVNFMTYTTGLELSKG